MNSTFNETRDNITSVLSNGVASEGHTLFTLVGLSLVNILGIVIGTPGNCLVVFAVIFNKELHSPTNLFIANLSIADFFVTCICMPLFFVYNVITWPSWPFGNATCRLVSYLVHVSVMASALSLLSISYDRFLSVYFPLKRISNIYRAKIIIALIWVVSPLLMLASLFHHEVVEKVNEGKKFILCVEKWSTDRELHNYQMYRISFYFLFVVQITVVYFLIGRRLHKRQPPGFQTMETKNMILLQKRKVTKMLFLVVLCFTFSWLPYIINKLLNIFPPWDNFKSPDVFVFVGNFLGLLNSCINPILYALLNHKLRKAFKNAIRCRWNYAVEERRRRVSEPKLFQECQMAPLSGRRERRLSSISSILQNPIPGVSQSTSGAAPEPVQCIFFRKLDTNSSNSVDCYQIASNHGKRRVSFSDALDASQLPTGKEMIQKASSLDDILETPGDERDDHSSVDRPRCSTDTSLVGQVL